MRRMSDVLSRSARDVEERLLGLPKAEVHIHLEGCFEVDELVALAAAANERLPRPAENLFAFSGLDEFLRFLDWSCGLVRTPEQLARAAYRFCEREGASGVRYADVIVNPSHWSLWRDRLDAFVDALDAGFREAAEDGLPPVGVCISLLRTQSATEAMELVDWLLARRHRRVVALSIDGDEARSGRTGPRFADAFRRAGAGGLKRTVHAGESSGAEGVRDAIEFLGADRIDHGVRAIEDPELVKLLAGRRIPLGVCPGSNVALGLYPDRRSHPLDDLRRAGVPVSINTDDPSYFDLRLSREYALAVETFGWDDEVVRAVARTSLESSFCDDDTRRHLLKELEAWRPD